MTDSTPHEGTGVSPSRQRLAFFQQKQDPWFFPRQHTPPAGLAQELTGCMTVEAPVQMHVSDEYWSQAMLRQLQVDAAGHPAPAQQSAEGTFAFPHVAPGGP